MPAPSRYDERRWFVHVAICCTSCAKFRDLLSHESCSRCVTRRVTLSIYDAYWARGAYLAADIPMNHRVTRRAWLGLLVGLVAAVGFSSPASSEADALSSVKIVRDAKDPRWVHGTVTVSATPDAVMQRLSRIDQWPQFLSDIKSMKVVQHNGDDWHVKLETRTMDCGAHDYYLKVKKRGIGLKIDATGIDAYGAIAVRASNETGKSVASFSMFADTTGVIGWLIPTKTLRARQEKMVVRDLEDLAKSFAGP